MLQSLEDQAAFTAVDRMLQAGCDAADRLADAAQRRRALMRHVMDSRDRILALMGDEASDGVELEERTRQLALMKHGTSRWLSMVRRIRYGERGRVARNEYRWMPRGAQPFRDADHGEIAIRSVEGDDARVADVEPFTCARASRKARSQASLRWLLPRRMAPSDLRSTAEQALIGQWGLFARKAIPAGTCIGVYGGQLLDDVDLFLLQDDRYLMSASDVLGEVAVNGENIMSLMNTLFEVDEQGAVTGHPPHGYNVVAESFRATFQHGWQARIRAFRAAEDIREGEELRWNYGLGTGLV